MRRFPLYLALATACFGTSAAQDIYKAAPHAKRPSLASDGTRLFLTYTGGGVNSGNSDVYFSSSADGGKTWTTGVNLSNDPGLSANPAVAVEHSGAVDVVWQDTKEDPRRPDIFFIRSTDGGATWSPRVNVTSTAGASAEPALAVGPDDQLHMVWAETGEHEANPDICYTNSLDHGKSWSHLSNVSHTPGISSHPAVAVGIDGGVHVAWSDTSSGADSPDIYYSRLRSSKWTRAADISNTPGRSTLPDIAVSDNGSVYIVWVDSSEATASPDIFLAVATSNGDGDFSFPQNISNTPGISSEPAVAARGENVAIVWRDTTAGLTHPDVWMATSVEGGHLFCDAENLSDSPGTSWLPDVAILKDRAVAAWEEVKAGDSDIELSNRVLK